MKPQHYVAIAALVVASACGGSNGGGIADPPGYGTPPPVSCTPGAGTVCLQPSNSFDPSSITIAKGGAVTWNNTTGVTHNVTFNAVASSPGNSTNFASGTFSATFPTAGTYPYHCTIHGLSMSGTVIVQ